MTTLERPQRRSLWLLAAVVGALAMVPLTGDTAHAAVASVGPPIDAGEAVVVSAANQSQVLTAGSSADSFSVRLPKGATCPGDTMADDWRVQSFVVPVADDPGTLSYGVIGPTGSTQYALHQVDTRPFANALVPAKTSSDGPALVGALPPFSFAVFPPGTLPDGRYRIGVACTYFRQTAEYWHTEIVVTNTTDGPASQFMWRVDNPAASSTSSDSSRRPLLVAAVVVVGVVGLGAAGIRVARRRSPRSNPLAKEHS